jgi:hypothetical protein
MMSYLYVCEQNGIEVLSYTDSAEATLQVLENGSGRFSKFVCIQSGHKTKENSRSYAYTKKLTSFVLLLIFVIVHEPSCEIR